ncbi:uncharacterized protein [Gossypium hirsutum]|uniref:Uncharacterized protein n=1 Tax=Gossypium hirsutum TaxID=3635 RepID=A0ABM3BWE6_GOSHI|nr:uncharacterized protein LOC121230537 [Gossypium hirsutum]
MWHPVPSGNPQKRLRPALVGLTDCIECEPRSSWINQQYLHPVLVGLTDENNSNASRANNDAYKKHLDDMLGIGCLMLATMTLELQKQYEDIVAYDMIQQLKELYEAQAHQERYETYKDLFRCKMVEGSPVGTHVLTIIGYIESLEKLGFPLGVELATDVILQSLSNSFSQFILNFNMNEINKTLP